MSDKEKLLEILRESPEIEPEAFYLLMTIKYVYESVEKKRRLKNGR